MVLPITVLLVDDHTLVRRGFRRLLEDDPELSVIGEAANGGDATRLAQELRPGVVVMDYSLPDMTGVEATRRIVRDSPRVAVLILSVHAEPGFAQRSREAGARGYVQKSAADVDLAAIVKRVAAGETLWQNDTSGRPVSADVARRLSPRQREVLRLMCDGLSNPMIAARLGISVHTVSAHRVSMMRALDIHRTGELIAFAIRQGLVDERL